MNREIQLPTDTGQAQPATPARDLRMIPHVEPVKPEVQQYTPQEVPQRPEPSAPPE